MSDWVDNRIVWSLEEKHRLKLPFEPPASMGSKNRGGHFASLARAIALSGKDEAD